MGSSTSSSSGPRLRRRASAPEAARAAPDDPSIPTSAVVDHVVRAIVVHHNRPDAAGQTCRALLQDPAVARVVIVDSGSDPAMIVELVESVGDLAQIVLAGSNVGFGPGANLGLRAWLDAPDAEPWAVIAPHDAAPMPGCVSRLVAALATRPRGAMACAEYGPGEDFRPTVDKFFGGSFVAAPRGEGWETVDYAHGTLLAFRPDALRDIGLFDERFFAYCEEADIGIRARRAGWEVGLVWGAVVANGKPPRADLGRYLQLRNTFLLLEKHFGVGAVVPRLAWEVGLHLTGGVGPTLGVGVASGASSPKRELRRASLLAIRDYLMRNFGPPPSELLARPPQPAER